MSYFFNRRTNFLSKRFKLCQDNIYFWGRKNPSVYGLIVSRIFKKKIIYLEDGFLCSSLHSSSSEIISIVIDDLSIYYDCSKESRLDKLISQPLSDKEYLTTLSIINRWKEYRLSKYNQLNESDSPNKPFILLVDQVYGDLSITFGNSNSESFDLMLEWALNKWKDHIILIREHPDIKSKGKKGYLSSKKFSNSRIIISNDGLLPCKQIERCDAICTVTSQLGFEGLIWNKPVYVFGSPFYSGWGHTYDIGSNIQRNLTDNVTKEQIIYSSLVKYPIYINPDSNKITDIFNSMQLINTYKNLLNTLPSQIEIFGFSLWKRGQIKRFLSIYKKSKIRFSKIKTPPMTETNHIYLWGIEYKELYERFNKKIFFVEDGFIRSVGLGVNLFEASSWIFDDIGIYYDAQRSSRLELLLNSKVLSNKEQLRSTKLINTILSNNLTKYNLNREEWNNTKKISAQIVLVIGQVPFDSSLKYGVPEDSKVKSNLDLVKVTREAYPNSWIIYKPHPDIDEGIRFDSSDSKKIFQHCNEIASKVSIESLLNCADIVSVLTSLAGFEALLRKKTVITWGLPFYAGWGLTIDNLSSHKWIRSRRNRMLDIETLVYVSLIEYPLYVSLNTNKICSVEDSISEICGLRDSGRDKFLSLYQFVFRYKKLFMDYLKIYV